MSTGSENEQTTQTQTSQTQPPIPSLPPSPCQLAVEPPSLDVSEQVLLLLNNADNKTLREVICHCQNVMKSRIISDDNILNNQFSVVPNVLTAYSESVGPTTSNEAGSLLLSPSNAQHTP